MAKSIQNALLSLKVSLTHSFSYKFDFTNLSESNKQGRLNSLKEGSFRITLKLLTLFKSLGLKMVRGKSHILQRF